MTIGHNIERDSLGRKKRKTVIRNQTLPVSSPLMSNKSVLFVVTKKDPIVLVTRQLIKCGEWKKVRVHMNDLVLGTWI